MGLAAKINRHNNNSKYLDFNVLSVLLLLVVLLLRTTHIPNKHTRTHTIAVLLVLFVLTLQLSYDLRNGSKSPKLV